MTKKVISNQEYLQLLGLKSLAVMYESKLRDLNLAVLDILQETENDGVTPHILKSNPKLR